MVEKWPFLKLKFSNFFLPKLKNTLVKNIFDLCHRFWSNWVLDTLSPSKWPSASKGEGPVVLSNTIEGLCRYVAPKRFSEVTFIVKTFKSSYLVVLAALNSDFLLSKKKILKKSVFWIFFFFPDGFSCNSGGVSPWLC